MGDVDVDVDLDFDFDVDLDGDDDVDLDACVDDCSLAFVATVALSSSSRSSVTSQANYRRGHAERSDQLVRAAESVVRNMRKVVAPERYEYGIRLLESVVAMRTKML